MSGAPALPDVTVRVLDAGDVTEVVRLEVELFGSSAWSEAMVREELVGPARWYVGVEGDRRLVAYAGLWFDGDDAQVMTIGVDPAVRRRGLGATLLESLLSRARELRARSVLLEVRVDNAPAIALYERAGFAVLGRRRRYYQPEDVDAWTMRLAL